MLLTCLHINLNILLRHLHNCVFNLVKNAWFFPHWIKLANISKTISKTLEFASSYPLKLASCVHVTSMSFITNVHFHWTISWMNQLNLLIYTLIKVTPMYRKRENIIITRTKILGLITNLSTCIKAKKIHVNMKHFVQNMECFTTIDISHTAHINI